MRERAARPNSPGRGGGRGSGVEPFRDASGGPPEVRGHLHRPGGAPRDGLVLTHGAGFDSRAPLLVALAEAFAARGLTVLRCDFVCYPRPVARGQDR